MAVAAGLASLIAAGCERILGLQPAGLYQPDGGTGSTASAGGGGGVTSTSSSNSGTGTGGSAPQTLVLAHFQNVQLEEIATDAATGAIYVVGTFLDKATFGSTVFNTAGGSDVFLAKLDASGVVAWAKQLGGPKDDSLPHVAFHGHAVTVVGHAAGAASVGAQVLIGDKGIFAVRYSEEGVLQWTSDCVGDVAADGVALNPTNDNAILAGFFAQMQCGAVEQYAQQDNDVFVTMLDAVNGAEVKTQTYTGGMFNYAYTVATDNFGGIFLGGRNDTMTLFGSYQLPADAMYAVKLHVATAGDVPWAKGLGDGSAATVASDPSGDLFVFGECADTNKEFGGAGLSRSHN